jgi:tetratricopeptide (TPR) repeat protein
LKRTAINIIVLIILLILSGCSAQKNTGLSRAYHNLTARYNVLFNGSESYKDGIAKIEQQYKDDYTELLPVFTYSDKEIPGIVNSDMERTVKKCSKLITLHSITAKPKARDNKTLTPDEREFFSKKEYNVYVDDAYLLMGKAHFYKHEYALAEEIFRKIIGDFKNQPVIYETQIWLARIAIENKKYIDASELLSGLNNNASLPEKLTNDLYTTYADYYLRQKDFPNAIAFLEKVLPLEKKKKHRTRYLFILAQLYEKTGDLKKASDYYDQVIKMNPVYDMAFNAHINRALAYEQGFGRADEIENELNKMLRDDKNIDYQDQIYYALGNLAIKEGDEKKALEYYTKSIKANKGNSQQKIKAYLTLANHYYSIPDYPDAQAYYDSAVSKIDADYPGYNELFTKSKSLTRLVNELNTVKEGDSVLILAQLPKDELNKRIDEIIAQERQREEQARIREQEEQLNEQFGQETAMKSSVNQATSSSTQWYFYNDAARTMGYREFKLKWGNRRLEDNWQRASKAMTTFTPGLEDDSELQAASDVSATENKLSRDYYISTIPATDSAVQAVNKNIELALYNMGMIYKDELKDYDKAAESFKELIKRFPDSGYLLSAYYNLYGIAREQNNQALIDYYKNIIASQFPQSMYAKVLTDPEYFKELEKEDLAIRQYYEQTYELYKAGNYNEVISRTSEARKTHPSHLLIPQFHYLGVLAGGKLSDNKVFRDSLITITARYPGTDIASDARNLIDYMDKEHPEIKEAEEVQISKELYQYAPVSRHHFIFAIDKNINTNQLVFNIINYNLDHSDSLNLIVDIISLNASQNLVSVKTFRNQEQARKYLDQIVLSGDEIQKDMPQVNLIPFIISDRNLNTLREDKSVDRYLKFYHENYK